MNEEAAKEVVSGLEHQEEAMPMVRLKRVHCKKNNWCKCTVNNDCKLDRLLLFKLQCKLALPSPLS